MTAPAEYVASLSTSGKLKMKAKALLALGEADERFEACVLLHEAARIERRAAVALPGSTAETRLRALVEECGCLVEGYDPMGAADAWSRIVREREHVDPATASAMLSRIEPRFTKAHVEFAKAATTFKPFLRADRLVPESRQEQVAEGEVLARATERFPGVVVLWWATYRNAQARRQSKNAWNAITRAWRLRPESKKLEAFRLFVASWALTPQEADAVLAAARNRVDSAGPQVCLAYAFAELRLAQRAPAGDVEPSERWSRARAAARAGLAQAPEGMLWKYLRAIDMLVTALLEGNAPTVELLYAAGLSDLAVAAPPKADLVALLSDAILQAA